MEHVKRNPRTTRRAILRDLGLALATMPVARVLAACSGTSATGTGGGASSSTTASTATSGGTGGAASEAGAWASGGTASMTAKASYPNPFASGAPSTCALSCEMTQGPCYDAEAVELQDISYGQPGLPVRMVLQIVDEDCKPVSGAEIDVWHVSPAGKYSGDDSANEDVAYCTGNDSTYTSALFFRGKQTTDATGVTYFDTCFPGWYSGRTIHVHFTIRVGGAAFVTTQLFFDDTLDDAIVASQPIYDARGKRDTTNEDDGVITAAALPSYLFETKRMSDGAMLAWKTLVVRKATSESICSISNGTMGGGPDGGPGGPPQDGG